MADNRGESVLAAQQLCISFGTFDILKDTSLNVHADDRIGIVGRNGVGKSTLLKIIAGVDTPSSGTITKKKNLRVAYLPQNFELDDNRTVRQNILDGAGYVRELISRYESLDAHSAQAARLEEEITHLNGWEIDQMADVLMVSLNTAAADDLVAPLSGGEKRRVALAKTLMSEPDFLILDEPTNHLDTESIEWLENFLSKYKGALLLVTHDRYFLDRVSNHIFELDNGKIQSYQGNYSDYLIKKSELEATSETLEHKRQQHLKKELDWVRAGVKARTTKSKGRLQRYHDEAKKDSYQKEINAEIILPPAPIMSNKTVQLTNVSKSFGDKTLFTGLDLTFEPDRHIGIVGRNGMGKTTLVNMILGKLASDTGSIEIGPRTQFNYVDQNRMTLNPENSILEEVAGDSDYVQMGDKKVSVWTYLKRFLFLDEKINAKISTLSGGERSRVLLAKVLKNGGNFLILDEPTNDLDLPTLRVLEEALISFAGCVLVISHDRYFLNRVCSGIIAFEGDGKLFYQEGDYDYYLEKKQERELSETLPKVKEVKLKSQVEKPTGSLKKLSYKEERELEGMEELLLAKEARIEEIDELFNDPSFFTKHGDQAADLNKEREDLTLEVEGLYARWEKLEAQKDAYANR